VKFLESKMQEYHLAKAALQHSFDTKVLRYGDQRGL